MNNTFTDLQYMSESDRPYNNNAFVWNVSTPVATSTGIYKYIYIYIGDLQIYWKLLSPLLRGLGIGMGNGCFN